MPKVKTKVTQEQVTDGWGGGFLPAPVGVYKARTRTVTYGYSKNADGSLDKSRDRLEVVWELLGRVENGKAEPLPARYSNVWDYVSFSDGHAPKMAAFAVAIGKVDPNSKKKTYNIEWDYNSQDFQVKAAQGKEAIITLTPDTDLSGNYRPRVGATLPLEGAEDSEADEDFEDEDDEAFEADDEADETEAEAPAVPTAEEIDALDKNGLAALADEAGVDYRGKKKNEVRQMLKDYFAEQTDGAEDEDDDDLPF